MTDVKYVVIAALAGCAVFEDPNIVTDIRPIGMAATVPEQVLDVDLANPPAPADLLAMMQPTMMCALIADPTNDRRLRWTMTLCPGTSTDRCDDGDPQAVIGSGLADDPELAEIDVTKPESCLVGGVVDPRCMCAIVNPNSDLLAVLLQSLNNDSLGGFQGLDYAVQLRVGGENADPSLDQYASKALRVAARVPANRTANTNPDLMQMQGQIDNEPPMILPFGRCADGPMTFVAPGTKINMFPVETADAREMYVIPTLDGGSEMFTESLTYQWIASGGGISRGDTGGPRDPFGNDAPLDSDWTAPKASDLHGATEFTIWIIQRDERLGAKWFETCFSVSPP